MKSILIKLKGHPHVQKGTAYTILFAMGFCHLLNDMIQSVIPAMYPVLKDNFGFTFAQIGIITLVFQLTSSIFQPFVGQYADRRPQPYSLSAGMCFTLTGLLLLAFASNFFLILLAVAIIGCGSSVFHPEASRVAQIASGGRKSLAQSIFQVGGNGGSAIGPLLAALIIIPYGQHAVGWFSIAALLASAILVRVGYWYKLTLSQSGMSYERGYCRPECTKCSEVCPTGAIRPITVAEKSSIQIGHAVWVKKNCIPLTDGVDCGNCARHCPVGAIQMVPFHGRHRHRGGRENSEQDKTIMIPVINTERCIGCGTCENLCPARPFSAIYVEGHEHHRII